MENPADTHAKHLRMVQLSISLVSVGLLISMFVERPSDSRRAYDELAGILTALQPDDSDRFEVTRWDGSFLSTFTAADRPPGWASFRTLVVTLQEGRVLLRVPDMAFALRRDEETKFKREQRDTKNPYPISPHPWIQKPRTLQDFIDVWDDTSSGFKYYVPTSHALKVWDRGEKLSRVLDESDADDYWIDVEELQEGHQGAYSEGPSFIGMYPSTLSNKGVYSHVLRFGTGDSADRRMLLLPVKAQEIRFRASPLRDALGLNTPDFAPFSKSFPYLSRIPEDLRKEELGALRTILDHLRQREDQGFEGLGLKLPAAGIRFWGLPLLVALQLYFVLHLRAFRRLMSQSNFEPSTVPWIAFYPDPLSRATVLAVLVFLPPAVVIAVGFGHGLGTWSLADWLIVVPATLGSVALAARALEVRRLTTA